MSRRRWCVALFVFALALRLLWLGLLLLSHHRFIGASDSHFYDEVAWNLVKGHGYSFGGAATAFHPPGYPILLAAIYEVAGRSQGAAQLVGILVSAVAPVLTVILADQLGLGTRVSRLSGVIMAIYPSQIFYSTFIGSEALCTILILGAAVSAMSRRYAVSALLLGAAALTRSIALVFIPLLIAAMLWDRRQSTWLRKTGIATIIVAVAILPLVPWTIRNQHQLGSPIFTTTSDGYALWAGNSPGATGYYRPIPDAVRKTLPKDEVGMDAELRRQGISFVVHHPTSVIALVPRKLYYLFVPDVSGLSFNRFENPSSVMDALRLPLAGAAEVYNAVVLIAAAMSFPLLWRRHRRAAIVLGVPMIAFVAGVVATHAENRYRIPVAWLYVIPAAVAFGNAPRLKHATDLATSTASDS